MIDLIEVAAVRLAEMIESADPVIYRAGIDWYPEARLEAEIMANTYGLEADAVIGVIAALSPQRHWDRNLIQADQVIRHWLQTGEPLYIHYGRQVHKAVDILRGANPLDILNGPKERPFYLNITTDEWEPVTVDRHIHNVWKSIMSLLSIGVKSLTDKVRRLCIAAFHRVARMLDILPKEAQAVTWVLARGL